MDFGLSIKGIGIVTTTPSNVTTTPPRKSASTKRDGPSSSPKSPRSPSYRSKHTTVTPKRTNFAGSVTQSPSGSVPDTTVSSSVVSTSLSPTIGTEPSSVLSPNTTGIDTPPSVPVIPEPSPLSVDDGTVRLRFNHYNDSFTIVKGCISPTVIIDKYCFNFVYKGNYKIHLFTVPGKEMVQERSLAPEEIDLLNVDKDKYNLDNYNRMFIGLTKDTTYVIEIEDDPIEKEKLLQNTNNRKQLNAQELTHLRLGIVQNTSATTESKAGTIGNP